MDGLVDRWMDRRMEIWLKVLLIPESTPLSSRWSHLHSSLSPTIILSFAFSALDPSHTNYVTLGKLPNLLSLIVFFHCKKRIILIVTSTGLFWRLHDIIYIQPRLQCLAARNTWWLLDASLFLSLLLFQTLRPSFSTAPPLSCYWPMSTLHHQWLQTESYPCWLHILTLCHSPDAVYRCPPTTLLKLFSSRWQSHLPSSAQLTVCDMPSCVHPALSPPPNFSATVRSWFPLPKFLVVFCSESFSSSCALSIGIALDYTHRDQYCALLHTLPLAMPLTPTAILSALCEWNPHLHPQLCICPTSCIIFPDGTSKPLLPKPIISNLTLLFILWF